MKNLYQIQTLLVVIFSLLTSSWAFGQSPDPIQVNLRNSGSSYSDQFAASTGYSFDVVEEDNPQLGTADIIPGTENNTLKVMYTPSAGAVGICNVIVSYYTLSAPMHPVTRWYRFHVDNELVVAGKDEYLVDSGSVNTPFPVLENDSSTGGALSITSVSTVNEGTTSINASGDTIFFTPNTEFNGDTWIQYVVCDSGNNCMQGNIHVLVRDPNLQDEVTLHKYLLNEQPLEILTPFEDFQVDIAPSHGTLDSTGAFSFVYTPDEGFTGNDTFQVGLAGLVIRTYHITVYDKAINVQARDDKFYVRPGLSVSFNVLNNDLLIDFDVESHTNPTKGVLFDLGNGAYTYTPNTGYRGVDKFTYTTCFQDTVYCETATVFLHVTDLEPENVLSYQLQTSKDLPLAMDYPIAYTDFNYIISNQADHGELIYYEGLQNIQFPCDTIDSYNMLVYEPEPGYTGTDHFEYYYCVQPSNLCYLVKVDMNVIDEPESESCPCVLDCVWPGDASLDGRVDMADLLTIGNKLGETGPTRSYSDPENWFGQHADEWNFSGNGTSIQYLDANGDGEISTSDVDIINEYYYRTHDVVVRDVQQKLPYQFSIIPVQFSLDSGDLVILDISFGNANVPVLDMEGTKFSINVPPAMMDSASVTVDFHQHGWLADGSPFISLGRVPWNGRIDAGFAKAGGNGSSGYGVIGTITFIITDDVEGFKTNNGLLQIPISLQAGTAMGSDGTMYDVEGDEIILTYELHPSNKNDYKLIVYPNPAQDIVDIHLNGKTEIESVDVIDPQGRVIRQYDQINQKHHQVDVNSLPVGLYYLQVHHTHGRMTQLLSVIR